VKICKDLNITSIVASVNDFQTRKFLDASPYMQSYYNNGFFFVYRIKNFDSAWIDANSATVDLVKNADDEIVLHVQNAKLNATGHLKIYSYPLWRAVTDSGQAISVSRDDVAQMLIAFPPGEDYSLTLRYEEGIIETLGNLVSVSSSGILASVATLALITKARAR